MSDTTTAAGMSVSQLAVLQQQVDQFFASAESDSTLMTAFVADPLGTLGNNGVQLPTLSTAVQPIFSQSIQDIILPPGTTTKRNLLTGSANSVACWSCTIVLTATIYAALVGIGAIITTASGAVLFGSDGLALPPVIAALVGATRLATATITAIAEAYGTTAAVTAAAGGGAAAGGIAVAISRIVSAICNAIPNCCSSSTTSQSDGLWHSTQMTDETSVRPAVALVGKNVLLGYKDTDNGDLWSILYNPTQGTGGSFTNRVNRNNCWTLSGTAMASFNGAVFCVYLDNGNALKIASTTDGITWSTDASAETVIATNLTTVGVGLSAFSGNLYCAFKANDTTVQTLSSSDGTSWVNQPNQIAGATTSCEPSLAEFQGKLFCVFRGAADSQLRFVSTVDGAQWSPVGWMPESLTPAAPALCVFNGYLYCFYARPDLKLAYTRTQDGLIWYPEEVCAGLTMLTGPAVAASTTQMFAAFRGNGTSHIIWGYTTPSL